MTKVYIVTEEQMQSLRSQLELSTLRANNHLSKHDPKTFENDALFRTFNFVVCGGIDEVGK